MGIGTNPRPKYDSREPIQCVYATCAGQRLLLSRGMAQQKRGLLAACCEPTVTGSDARWRRSWLGAGKLDGGLAAQFTD